MKYKKYMFGAGILGVFFLIMFAVATPSFASGKANNPTPRIRKDTLIGIIQVVNNDSYTIQVKKGEETSIIDVKFDTNTRLSPKDRMNRDMMNNLSPRARHQNMKNFSNMTKSTNSIFKVGDTIQVMGKIIEDNTIQAESMRKINLPKVIKNLNINN